MNAGLAELGLPVAATEIPLSAAFQNAAADHVALFAWRTDSIAAYARTIDMEGVAMISIDDDWSALRLKVLS